MTLQNILEMKTSKNFLLAASIILCNLFSTAACFSQNQYSLKQCTQIALEKSLQLKINSLDRDITNASIQQAYSGLLPNITAKASYQYSPNVQTSVLPAETFGGPAGTYQTAMFGVAQSKSASAELTQNIFNPSVMIGLKAAKVQLLGNYLTIRSSQEDLVYNVAATYYNIQSLLKQEELTKSSLQNTEQLLTSTHEQLLAGLATQTDADRLTVTRDNTKANLERLQNNKEKYYNLLKVLMNLPLQTVLNIEPFEEGQVESFSLNDFNPVQKTNYLQLMQSKRVAELQYKNIRAGHQPTLSAYANLGYTGYNSKFDLSQNINNRYYPASALGVRLSISVFDGFSIKHQARQKKIEISRYSVQAEQTLQQNERDQADASADLRSNLLTYQIQTRNLILAQKVMMDINQQYKSGIVKVIDVINTTSDLQTAQNNYVTALINIKQAEINLKKAQGTLLDN